MSIFPDYHFTDCSFQRAILFKLLLETQQSVKLPYFGKVLYNIHLLYNK